jgi:Cu/Ag efflux protein CusF
MKKESTVALVGVFILGTAISAWALWGFGSSIEGTVKDIGANAITIMSESQDGQAAQEMSLVVNEQTKLNDVASLNELREGDQVKINYREEGSQRIATQIAKQEEEESSPNYSEPDSSSPNVSSPNSSP